MIKLRICEGVLRSFNWYMSWSWRTQLYAPFMSRDTVRIVSFLSKPKRISVYATAAQSEDDVALRDPNCCGGDQSYLLAIYSSLRWIRRSNSLKIFKDKDR